jgi:transcriptional regulator with XRE-family HTH domain
MHITKKLNLEVIMKEFIPLDLRVTRVRSGLSNRDLAHLLDCNKERVSKLEHGKARTATTEIIALGLIYGQSIDGIFRQTAKAIIRKLKQQLTTMPCEPANWSKHAQNRLDTLNGLTYRLQALTDKPYEA